MLTKKLDHDISWFLKSVAFVLALGLSAGFVEMTNLPVRFNQTGFSFWYWAVVVVVITLTYRFLMQIFLRMSSKKAKNAQAIRLS